MYINIDQEGYVTNWMQFGEPNEQYPTFIDFEPNEHFYNHWDSYKYENGQLTFSEIRITDRVLDEYRDLRKRECFSVIDRSSLWYKTLTEEQVSELQVWYDAWLQVTETMEIPEKPSWL